MNTTKKNRHHFSESWYARCPSTRGDLSLFVGIFNGSSRVDLPRWKWYPLLKTIILPMRSKRIAQNYQSIWTEQGSPPACYYKATTSGFTSYLTDQGINAQVEIAMTYGNPSMQSAVKKFTQK